MPAVPRSFSSLPTKQNVVNGALDWCARETAEHEDNLTLGRTQLGIETRGFMIDISSQLNNPTLVGSTAMRAANRLPVTTETGARSSEK